MPSWMHELSSAAVRYKAPVDSNSMPKDLENWTEAFAASEGAKRLQAYCTEAGLIPLSSEWWHFNDPNIGKIMAKDANSGEVAVNTKGTFDAYNWGLVENKQKFIGQIMTGKSPARSAEDVDATALSYAEVKALATGDDRIREKMDLDVQVAKLKMLKANHVSMQYEMQDKALKYYPQKIAETKLFIEALGKDLPIVQAHPVKDDAFSMTIMGQTFTERKAAGEAIIKACLLMTDPEKPLDVGEYRGFPMQLHCDGSKFKVTMKQNLTYMAELADDPVGNVIRINNALEGMGDKIQAHEARLATLEKELVNAQDESWRPFPKEDELRQKSARLNQLNRELENPRHKAAEQSQDEDDEPDLGGGDTPAREPFTPTVIKGGKPSIRAAIRSFNPPTPVPPGTEKRQRQEASL